MKLHRIFFVCLFLGTAFLFTSRCFAKQSWENVDKQVQNNVIQLNVGLKMKLQLQEPLWVQVAGLSTKQNYYTFTTSKYDRGYQVIGRGTAFIIKSGDSNKRFIVTSNHVLDNARQILDECQMFYTAAALYAQQTAPKDKKRFDQLLAILNLATDERSMEQDKLCQRTANAIWNCYDTYLSSLADPHRILFNRYQKSVPIMANTNYFLHPPGSVGQKTIEATVYKRANAKEADLAILVASMSKLDNYQGLELDLQSPKKYTQIQVIGYPALVNQFGASQNENVSPRCSNGKITGIRQPMIQFDASITKGNSGGPLINNEGKVLGIVTVRSMTKDGQIMPHGGGAVSVQALKLFAPELFGR